MKLHVDVTILVKLCLVHWHVMFCIAEMYVIMLWGGL